MNNSSNFYDHYQDAKNKKAKQQFQQAKIAYIAALKFSHAVQQVQDRVSALGQLGDVYRELKIFTQSKNAFLKGIDILNTANRNRKIQEKDYMKQKYHLQSNLALTYVAQIDDIDDHFKYHQKVQMLNDSAIKNFKECQEIVITMVYKSYQSHWWSSQYAALIANICTALYTEAFVFKDKCIFQLLLGLVDRLEQFTEQFKKNKDLRKNLYKTYFYRALSYKYIKKPQESEKYFLKDFKFENQYNQIEDLKKTREQLILFYEERRKFRQASKYCQTDFQKDYIRGRQNEYNKYVNRMKQIYQRMNNQQFQIDQLDDFLIELIEKENYFKEILQFTKKIKKTNAYKKDVKIRFCCQYNSALANFNEGNYRDANNQIGQAFNFAEGDPTDQIWCRILKAQIYDKIQLDRKKVEDMYKNCMKLAQSNTNQRQIQQCETYIKKFYVFETRKSRRIIFDDRKFRELMNYLKQKNRQPQNTDEIVQQMEIQNPVQNRRLNKRSPLQTYIELCKENNVNPRVEIRKCIQQRGSVDLGDFFNLEQKQIETILSSNPNIQTLDLRNHIVSLQLLRNIRNSQAIIGVKKLKLNCVNAYNKSRNTQTYNNLVIEMIKNMPLLQYLSFLSQEKLDFIQKLTSNASSLKLQNIRVLKLKQCNLQDSNLLSFKIQNTFPKLQELSLSHNYLEGSSLGFINELKLLSNLDLSYNPLGKADIGSPKHKFRKVSIKGMKQIPLQSLERLIFLLLKCQMVDLSHSIQSSCLLLQMLSKQVYQSQIQLSQLRNLKLFDCLIGSNFSLTCQKIMYFSPNLEIIDLRSCSVNEQIVRNKLVQMQEDLKTEKFQSKNKKERKMLLQNLRPKQINFNLI